MAMTNYQEQTLNIYYVPKGGRQREMKDLWLKLDADKNGEARSQSHITKREWERISEREVSLQNLIKGLEESANIIISNISQLGLSMKALRDLLMKKNNLWVSVTVLNPIYWRFDLKNRESLNFFSLFEEIEDNTRKLSDSKSAAAKKISDDTIKDLKKDRREGLSIRELAHKYTLSTGSCYQYTKEVPYIRRPAVKQAAKKDKQYESSFYNSISLADWRLSPEEEKLMQRFGLSKTNAKTRLEALKAVTMFYWWIYREKNGRKDISIKDIQPEDGANYLDHLRQKNLKPSYVAKLFRYAKQYLEYGEKSRLISSNPFSLIKTPNHRGEIKARAFSPSETNEILMYVRREVKNWKAPHKKMIAERNFLGLYLLATTGMRVGSLLSIKLKSIELHMKSATVEIAVKKSPKRSVLTLDENASRFIEKYLKAYFKLCSKDSYLFFRDPDDLLSPMNPSSLNKLLYRVSASLGLKGNISTHSFRVSYATQSYKEGLDIKEIQNHLGHKNYNQTAEYIKLGTARPQAKWLDIPADQYYEDDRDAL